jgi:hypothetical protein
MTETQFVSEATLVERIAVLEWDVKVLKERLESLEMEIKTRKAE